MSRSVKRSRWWAKSPLHSLTGSPILNECNRLISPLTVVIPFWRMKTALALAVLWLIVGASAQESKQPSNELLTGTIYGVVVDPDGQPVKGMRLAAVMECPSSCSFWMSETVTNQAGEYHFRPLPLGEKYSVFSRKAQIEYPRFSPAPTAIVELTVEHPNVELRVDLPPRVGILTIHLTDRTTGAFIPRGLVKIKVADAADSRWSEVWADSSNCLFFPDCAIPVPPDRQLLVHVSSTGFKEWDESEEKGKPLFVHSGARLTWDIQLEPIPD